MKIIFLDIDGVLNNSTTSRSEHHHNWPDWGFVGLDRRLVPHLNKIVAETGAKIVLSSTWRLSNTPEQMHARLVSAGMDPEIEIIDRTPSLRGTKGPYHGGYVPRRKEIQHWLDHTEEDVTDYVIIDDDSDAGIGKHFVRTNHDEGLTDEGVEAAIRILGAKK